MICCNFNGTADKYKTMESYDTANGMICCNSGASGAPKIKASEGAFSKIRPKMGKIADFNRGHCFESA